jgi:hypothetical protein
MNSDELATLHNLRVIEMILNDIYDRSDIINDLIVHDEIKKIYTSIHFLNDLYRVRE